MRIAKKKLQAKVLKLRNICLMKNSMTNRRNYFIMAVGFDLERSFETLKQIKL